MAELKLTRDQEALLRSQVFDDTHPGPILHDFELVLEYVGEKGVKAGGKYNLLPIDAIAVLDPQLARPLNLDLKRPQLRSHPYLQGLHVLFRASGLGEVQGQGAKARLVVNPDVLRSWRELNPTEQYFALLEAWLTVADPEMAGAPSHFSFNVLSQFGSLLYLYSEMAREHHVLQSVIGSTWGIHGDIYNLALMELFGLIALKTPCEGRSYAPPPAMTLTPFGEAMLPLLQQAADWEDSRDDWEELPREFGQLQPIFQPYFPQWQKNLALGKARQAGEGVFVFKVSLGRDVWRRIALDHSHTVDDLVTVILNTVDFDFDHLYTLTYRDEFGRTISVSHPECDEGYSADEVCLGELPIQPGDTLSLLYDFGDCWRFSVKLERIDPPDSMKKLPEVLESHGKSPEQYPD